jgi:hypothetical protein
MLRIKSKWTKRKEIDLLEKVCEVIAILISAHLMNKAESCVPHLILHWDKHDSQGVLDNIVRYTARAVRKSINVIVDRDTGAVLARSVDSMSTKKRVGHVWVVDEEWIKPTVLGIHEENALSITYGFIHCRKEEKEEMKSEIILALKIRRVSDWDVPIPIPNSLLRSFTAMPEIMDFVREQVAALKDSPFFIS